MDLYFLLDAVFRSSCTLSSSHCKNSKASCCCVPLYCAPCLSTTCLKELLNSGLYWHAHSAFNINASCSVTSPLVPNFFEFNLFLLLKSSLYLSRTKYSASTSVCEMHWITAFIKHVLPWLRRPVTPGTSSGPQVCRPTGGTRFSLLGAYTGTPPICWAILLMIFRNDGVRNTFLLLESISCFDFLFDILNGFLGSVNVRFSREASMDCCSCCCCSSIVISDLESSSPSEFDFITVTGSNIIT